MRDDGRESINVWRAKDHGWGREAAGASEPTFKRALELMLLTQSIISRSQLIFF